MCPKAAIFSCRAYDRQAAKVDVLLKIEKVISFNSNYGK
jgi:hypothetical protein